MSAPQPFSSLEVAWWQLDTPVNRAQITALLTFDAPLALDELTAAIETRLLTIERFRQRVRPARGPWDVPHWLDVDPFDLTPHFISVTPTHPIDPATLQELVGAAIASPLDRARPLWQLHYFDRVGTGSALLVRVHHSLIDGPQTVLRALLALTDQPFNKAMPALKPVRLIDEVWAEGQRVLREPIRAVGWAQVGVEATTYLTDMVWSPPDRVTLFKGLLGVAKRAAWSEPLPLGRLKAIGARTASTVNDVLLSALAGALRQYLVEHDQAIEQLNLTLMFALNLKRDHEPDRIGFGRVSLPIGLATADERLAAIKQRMARVKSSIAGEVSSGLLDLTGLASAEIARGFVDLFNHKATLIMTNVPGPRTGLSIAGQPIGRMMFFAPGIGGLGLCVSALSYADQITLGLNVDAQLGVDPEVLLAQVQAELDRLDAQ